MKRISLLLLLLSFVVLSCVSCGNRPANEDEKISVVCTSFAQYDWVCEIIGEKTDIFDVKFITDSGVDMHSYQPTANDIIEIAECDILISVGGVSEKWIDEAADKAGNGITHLKLTDMMGDGIMCVSDDHDHGHDSSHSIDEHVWLSLKNAMIFCKEIGKVISLADKENSEYYLTNTEKYIKELSEVDEIVTEFISSSPRDTVVMADRFPFRYTLRDYGIKYFAAFEGCSSDSEVTFETVINLAEVIDRLGLRAVLVTDDSDEKIAEAVISNSKSENIEIYKLDSMQSVSAEDIKSGMTYLSVMVENLALIHDALIV